MIRTILAAGAAAAGLLALALSAAARSGDETGDEAGRGRIDVARFDDQGRLLYPDNIDEWIHLGSGLGLDYRQGAVFDPDDPGPFEVVTMEPAAYRYFMAHGEFAEGTMFRLAFHSIARDEGLSAHGMATGPAPSDEIHYKDAAVFPDGFNFFTFREGQEAAGAVPLPNDCVECHSQHGDYDAVFVQFYPGVVDRLEAAEGQ